MQVANRTGWIRRTIARVGFLGTICGAMPVLAAVSLTTSPYLEDFDGLIAGGTFATSGAASPLSGDTGWDGARLAGSSSTATSLAISNGGLSSLSSGLYAFTNDLLNGERALGAFASDFNTMAFGVALVNNTGQAIVNPTIKYDREQWRSSQSAVDVLNFAYGLGGTLTAANYLASSAMTPFAALNAPGRSAVGSAYGPTNGNNPDTLLTVQAQLTGLTVPAGATLYLRWQDTNITDVDGALAIDNFSLTFTPADTETPVTTPEPAAIACFGLVGMVLGTCRRRRWRC
jgi:hypothetical protein